MNERKVAEGRTERTQPKVSPPTRPRTSGPTLGTPVVEAIGSERKSRITGSIPKVTIEVHSGSPRRRRRSSR